MVRADSSQQRCGVWLQVKHLCVIFQPNHTEAFPGTLQEESCLPRAQWGAQPGH